MFQTLTSRPYAGDSDLFTMLDLLMQGRASTDDWHYAHVGELLFNFFMVACHLELSNHIRLWHTGQGSLVAYAILGEDPSFDCQVSPGYEWIGIEAEALTWAEDRILQLKQQDAVLWSGEFVSTARLDNPLRIAFLEKHGFKYNGRFAEVNMLRPMSMPIPVLPIPPGRQVCSMVELNDIHERAAAHREVWQPWTVGNVMDDDYQTFMNLPGYHADLDVVSLTPQGRVAAYVTGWIDPVNRIGDFGPVGTRAEYRRQGYARLALLEGLRRMKEYGMNRVCISTGVSNTPALNLYRSLGFTVVNHCLDYNRIIA